MAAKLSPFSPHPPILSLLKKAPDAVPPTDELVELHRELELAKEKALERSKKANDDLKTIEESIRRMTEREKGKFKAIDKIKRERDCTYMLINYFEEKKKSDVWTCMHILTSDNLYPHSGTVNSPFLYLSRHSSSRCSRLQKLDPFPWTTIEIAYSLSSYQLITRLVFKIFIGPSEIVSLLPCINNVMFTILPKCR
jgi:hypothetical protein